MSDFEFYQPVYSPDGKYLGSSDHTWEAIRWRCDAWWDVSIPIDTTGMTYVDVGSAEGLYPLRFAQRGGKGLGLNPDSPYQCQAYCKLRDLYSEPRQFSEKLRHLYPGVKFEVLNGGFNNGAIEPVLLPSDYVSCMNCLEYVEQPRKAVESLFAIAFKQVIIATDIWLGPPEELSDGRCAPLKQKFVADELVSWFPWPARTIVLDYHHQGVSHPQGFFIARPNGDFSDLPESVDLYDPNGIFPTQKRYESTKV